MGIRVRSNSGGSGGTGGSGSDATYSDNLIQNNTADLNTLTGWETIEAAPTLQISNGATNALSGTRSFMLTGSTPGGVGYRAFPVTPGETYTILISTKGTAALASGLIIRFSERAEYPTTGDHVTLGNRDSFTNLLGNGPITTTWTNHVFTYTVPAGVRWVSFSVYKWTAANAIDVFFDNIEVRKSHSAATVETYAGYNFGDKPVFMRRFTGTMPDYGNFSDLFTPSTGSSSRLIDFKGWVIRNSSIQRHMLMAMDNSSDNNHASRVFQYTNTGKISIYHTNGSYSLASYDIVVYYTK